MATSLSESCQPNLPTCGSWQTRERAHQQRTSEVQLALQQLSKMNHSVEEPSHVDPARGVEHDAQEILQCAAKGSALSGTLTRTRLAGARHLRPWFSDQRT